MQIQPNTASAQVLANHHLTQIILVAANPRLLFIDHPAAHCFMGLCWT